MFVTQSPASSVAMSSSPAGVDIRPLPEEMVRRVLSYLSARDLTAFEGSQDLRKLIGPDVFNQVALNFIAECERTRPSEPWPSSTLTRYYAWARAKFEGTDEQFTQRYPIR